MNASNPPLRASFTFIWFLVLYSFLSLQQNVWTNSSILEVVFSGVVFEVAFWMRSYMSKWIKPNALQPNAHINIQASGLFWLMRVQYSSSNHFSSIVILFSFILHFLKAIETNLLKMQPLYNCKLIRNNCVIWLQERFNMNNMHYNKQI